MIPAGSVSGGNDVEAVMPLRDSENSDGGNREKTGGGGVGVELLNIQNGNLARRRRRRRDNWRSSASGKSNRVNWSTSKWKEVRR